MDIYIYISICYYVYIYVCVCSLYSHICLLMPHESLWLWIKFIKWLVCIPRTHLVGGTQCPVEGWKHAITFTACRKKRASCARVLPPFPSTTCMWPGCDWMWMWSRKEIGDNACSRYLGVRASLSKWVNDGNIHTGLCGMKYGFYMDYKPLILSGMHIQVVNAV